MSVSTSKSEAMVLCRKQVDCSLQVGTVKQALHRTVLVTRELPTFTYSHELWVMNKRTRSQIQAAKMSFSVGWPGLSLRERVRSSDIRREFSRYSLMSKEVR